MVNLGFINKAFSDKDVSDSEFRLLYLIANNIGFSGGEERVFYNSFLGEKLDKSERQIQNLTSSLCKKGYLIKRFSNEAGKEKTYYSLNVSFTTTHEKNFMGEKNFTPTHEKNFTLYNKPEEIINNNTSTRLGEISNEELNELIEEVLCKIDRGGDSVVEVYRLKKKLSGRLTPTQIEHFNYRLPDNPFTTSSTSKHPK